MKQSNGMKRMESSSSSKITHKDFKIHRQDGSVKPDIIKAFIILRSLSSFDIMEGWITENDHVMKLVIDPKISELFKTQNQVDCIISCQIRKSGHYAIARIKTIKEKEEKKQDEIAN